MNIQNQTQSQQFKRWFGDWQNKQKKASKIVNKDGTPKVVYHGTNADVDTFQSKSGVYWFSESEDYAEAMMEKRGGDKMIPAYLNIRNPYYAKLEPGKFSDPAYEKPIIQNAKAGGYDGVIIESDTENPIEHDVFFVVFDPTQIKHATENIGTFDRNNPEIRYSRKSPTAAAIEESENLLKQQLEYWLGKPKTGNGKFADPKDVRRVTRVIVEEYRSKANRAEISKDMQEIADVIVREGAEAVRKKNSANWTEYNALCGKIRPKAEAIARKPIPGVFP